MKLRPDQLPARLEHDLAPLYLIHGDEPLQVVEAADAVRAAARLQGHVEREVLTVEPGFNWQQFAATAASGSLFAPRRLLELRLDDARPGEPGARALGQYAAAPPSDLLLLITAARLEPAQQKSRWFTALERVGVVVQTWPLQGRQLLAWLERRLHERGLRPTPDALQALAVRVEGNLLAAAQEIEKLALLHGPGPLEVEPLLAAVGDTARYDVFDLVDAALTGRTDRVLRIVRGLREEGVEPVLIAWALAREVQQLLRLHTEQDRGVPPAQSLAAVRGPRRTRVEKALQRLDRDDCRQLLAGCARLDRTVKGLTGDDSWSAILGLSLELAGRRPWPADA
ncbi:MAG: DNA polymerase III subunit delta [Candidatus Competibacterales bacterium]|nr:DNA polymerase III subunit delta [Candidatus Competibacterales bacterium]